MDKLEEYSYVWESDKEQFFIVDDEHGKSIFKICGNTLMFVLIEDDDLYNQIVEKMIESGNKVYGSITELQESVGI